MTCYKCPICGYEFAWTDYSRDVICGCGYNLSKNRGYYPLTFTNEERAQKNEEIRKKWHKK